MCYGNASRNHRLKLGMTGKAKSHDYLMIMKQTVFPLLQPARNMGG
jgi:hypothetical protein